MKKRVAYCFVLWQASGGETEELFISYSLTILESAVCKEKTFVLSGGKTELAGECSATDCAQ